VDALEEEFDTERVEITTAGRCLTLRSVALVH
jgi:hypothetical protein